MENAIVLKEEVDTSISQRIDPAQLIAVLLPRMERALELAKTPQETNEIRTQVETVLTYVRRQLPKVNHDRAERLKITHPAECLYLDASRKAGAFWKTVEDKAKRGGSGSNQYEQKDNSLIASMDAGFKNAHDALDCVRLSELDDEDWRTYKEESLTNLRQATMGGAISVWQMLFGKKTQPVAQLSYPPHINAVYQWTVEGAEVLQTMVLEVEKGQTSRRAIAFAIEELTKIQQQIEKSKIAIGEIA